MHIIFYTTAGDAITDDGLPKWKQLNKQKVHNCLFMCA